MVKNTVYALTDEGKKYLKEGLPETQLVKSLKKSTTIEQARKSIDNFSIALQWAKKNGWVRVEKGKLVLVKKPDSATEQDWLKKASLGTKLTDKELSVLLSRKLIVKSRDDISKEAKKSIGKDITGLTPALIKTGMWKQVKLKPYNITAKGPAIYPGKRHPYNQFLTHARQKLIELGFSEMSGPMIELEFWNFDALYQAQGHPSRDWTQTYTLKYPKIGRLPDKKIVDQVKAAHENGWKTKSTGWGYEWSHDKARQLIPRAHTTACSARQLLNHVNVKEPGKYFALNRCFRPDVIDATHGVEFNQFDGIVIDESVGFREMLGLFKMFAKEMAGAEKVRFFPDYYPFTEPSVQLSAKHPEMGWIEFAGGGVFRPEVTEPMGIKQPVLAWGLGIDRLAMFKLGISDIRYLFSDNIEWLRNSKILRQ
jgi:phenylalanyl-tRNA synthetase alpha chain